MKKIFIGFIKFFLISVLFLPGITPAQSIGAGYVKMFSDNYEFENADGFIALFSIPISSITSISLNYLHLKNEREYFGYLASGFMAFPGPEKNSIKSEAFANSFEFMFSFRLFRTPHIDFSLGAGISITSYKAVRKIILTDEEYTFTSDSQFGFLLGLSVETNKDLFHGFSLFIDGKLKTSGSSTQITDSEQPFETVFLKGIQTGVKYSF
jgi:hypothetical protein